MKNLKLYLVVGSEHCRSEQHLLTVVEQAVHNGVATIQLREKHKPDIEIIKLAEKILRLLPSNITFIINDHVAIAKKLGVGVHIGQQDTNLMRARELLGRDAIIGLSIENLSQALLYKASAAHYFGVGPIFSTISKADAPLPIGITELKNITAALAPKPCVAIGGITATPVINKPEAAIVALGKTQKLPRFDEEGNVSAQHIMAVNWSGDHRIIDGATMVRFNNLWMSYLTQPEKMLMHLR